MGHYLGKLLSYQDTEISILASPDDVQVLLEDHIVKTTTMKGSPFIGPFEEEVNQWDITLVSYFLIKTKRLVFWPPLMKYRFYWRTTLSRQPL